MCHSFMCLFGTLSKKVGAKHSIYLDGFLGPSGSRDTPDRNFCIHKPPGFEHHILRGGTYGASWIGGLLGISLIGGTDLSIIAPRDPSRTGPAAGARGDPWNSFR